MLISLFPTPFRHFQFLGSAGQNPKLILTLCDPDDPDYPMNLMTMLLM